MDNDLLYALLAQRIPPEQFRVWSQEVHWLDTKFDTPENRVIIVGVIANYPALEMAYLAAQKAMQDNVAVLANLSAIDLKSIRSLREYVSAQVDAPLILKDHEAQAIEERAVIIK